MSDRLNSLTVVLETDIREDEAEALISAVQQLRGVLSVTGTVADIGDHIAQERVRRELGEKLWHVLYPEKNT